MKFKYFIIILCLTGFLTLNATDKPGKKGFDRAQMNESVSPSDDFYQYAIGNWLNENPIPDEYSRWGSFEVLSEENYKILNEILEQYAYKETAEAGSIEQKVGDFYFTGMDTVKIEELGITPIQADLNAIDAINNKYDLLSEISKHHTFSSNTLFSFYSSADAKNSKVEAAYLSQSGLGLPDRDYYLNDDDRSKEIREKYLQHIENMFVLAGEDENSAKASAEKIMEIETRLAESSMSRVDNRDPDKTYNNMSLNEVKSLSGGFDWELFLEKINVENPGNIIVRQPEFFKEIGLMMDDVNLEDWKPYLKWNVLRSYASSLSKNFADERFEFSGKFLNGLKAQQPRWKRMLQSANGSLGEAVGQLYVAKSFPPESKERALSIVNNLLEAMEERILALDWMSEKTKQEALKKLAAFNAKIGYPDKWIDYSSLEISRDSYVQNLKNSGAFSFRKNIEKIGKPVDPTEWAMSPQTVNAYYHQLKTEIVFPAAILQHPFFDPDADDAMNYGAMGGVIGHEITHGFDDKGRKYDAEGNLRDWWTEEDAQKFEERGKLMKDQFGSYMPIDTVSINADLTQGENIADLGGLSVAYTAFQKTDQYKNNEIIDGFTPSQRFFLSWAQVWKNNIRDEALLLRLKTDSHSPGKYRVIGTLSNMPEFWKAFDIKPGSPMRMPDDKAVKIW
jgi:putative endopeptidase